MFQNTSPTLKKPKQLGSRKQVRSHLVLVVLGDELDGVRVIAGYGVPVARADWRQRCPKRFEVGREVFLEPSDGGH